MIVITGATCVLNGATVERLLERVPAGQIGVSVRDVAKARHFADRAHRERRPGGHRHCRDRLRADRP